MLAGLVLLGSVELRVGGVAKAREYARGSTRATLTLCLRCMVATAGIFGLWEWILWFLILLVW